VTDQCNLNTLYASYTLMYCYTVPYHICISIMMLYISTYPHHCKLLLCSCFGHVQRIGFRRMACGEMIKCEKGILTGMMYQKPPPTVLLHGWMIQLLIAALILIVVVAYGML
jgi:hypothetical protein